MTAAPADPPPDKGSSDAARRALRDVTDYMRRHPSEPATVHIVVKDQEDTELVVPRSVMDVLAGALEHIAAGRNVSIVPTDAELTTQQAADLLNVSRPFLIKLLEDGEIAYRKVGTHRRVLVKSLLDYRRRDDARRAQAADELSAFTREMGMS
jgi:excisionase family DNA binding protein